MLEFDWDEGKAERNLAKHNLSFEDATQAFENPYLAKKDDRRDYGEDRFVMLGQLDGRTVVIAYTNRDGKIRLISARKANSREQEIYNSRIR